MDEANQLTTWIIASYIYLFLYSHIQNLTLSLKSFTFKGVEKEGVEMIEGPLKDSKHTSYVPIMCSAIPS